MNDRTPATLDAIAVTAIQPHSGIMTPSRMRSPLAGVSLGWDVLPDAPGMVALMEGRTPSAAARLVLRFSETGLRVFVCLQSTPGGGGEFVPVGDDEHPVSVTRQDDDGRVFVHVDAPGILKATLLMAEGRAPRVLYARTPLLASLGFPGGSYDRPVASVAGD